MRKQVPHTQCTLLAGLQLELVNVRSTVCAPHMKFLLMKFDSSNASVMLDGTDGTNGTSSLLV